MEQRTRGIPMEAVLVWIVTIVFFLPPLIIAYAFGVWLGGSALGAVLTAFVAMEMAWDVWPLLRQDV